MIVDASPLADAKTLDDFRPSTADLLSAVFRDCKAPQLRSLRQFALDEVFLPDDDGPFAGEKFTLENQPYVDLLWKEIEDGGWSEVFITGPSQSGKTLCSFVILVVYIAAELRKNVVVGVPLAEMANDKWQIDIRPLLEASPTLRKLIPVRGPGSDPKNKVKDSVVLTNGVTIKFMTKGGSDASKAAFTSPMIVVTEAAEWTAGVSTSTESDPLRQLRGRQKSKARFTDDGEVNTDRQLIVEGTVKIESDLPWRVKDTSSDSKIVCPCPHCKVYVAPEREHLKGWQKAKDELEAAAKGYFECPSCKAKINQDQRVEMVRGAKLIHKGQSIDKRGRITGDRPRTTILFFRWSAFHNLFLNIQTFAADEWLASQLEAGQNRDDAEREQCQQVWAVPYTVEYVDAGPLDRRAIRRRVVKQLAENILPPNTQHVVAGVDLGLRRCWYFVLALCGDGTLHCPLYGSQATSLAQHSYSRKELQRRDVKHHCANAIKLALHEIVDRLEVGFQILDSAKRMTPERVLVDSRYFPQAAFEVCLARSNSIIEGPYLACQGLGKTQLNERKYTQQKRPSQTIRKVGDRYHVEFASNYRAMKVVLDADDSKLAIQDCLRVTPGQAGALTLPMAQERHHSMLSVHLSAEIFRTIIDPATGEIKEEWQQTTKRNHWLDCAGYAWVAGKDVGWKIPRIDPPKPIGPTGRSPAWLGGAA